jgi:hypothetical protein
MAVRHHEGIVVAGSPVLGVQFPAALGRPMGMLDAIVELDRRPELERVGVVVEIGLDLGVVWVVG